MLSNHSLVCSPSGCVSYERHAADRSLVGTKLGTTEANPFFLIPRQVLTELFSWPPHVKSSLGGKLKDEFFSRFFFFWEYIMFFGALFLFLFSFLPRSLSYLSSLIIISEDQPSRRPAQSPELTCLTFLGLFRPRRCVRA